MALSTTALAARRVFTTSRCPLEEAPYRGHTATIDLFTCAWLPEGLHHLQVPAKEAMYSGV